MTWTRAQYMNGEVSHEDYYGQFVTDDVLRILRLAIGSEEIKASTDPAFNDIPLQRWDLLAAGLPLDVVRAVANANRSTAGGVASISLSDRVCVLKAAARKIRGDV